MDSQSQEPITMEKILKKVYDVHRQSLAETNAKLSKYLANNERLEEQVKQLQIDKENLVSDNRQLRTGDCCKVISTTLQTVTSSYEQLLQEKDARIRELEAELRRKKRGQSTAYLEDSQDEQSEPTRGARRHSRLPKQSPDSTSTGTTESREDSSNQSQSTPQQSQTKTHRKVKETANSAALKKKLSSSQDSNTSSNNSQDKILALSKKLSSKSDSSKSMRSSCSSQIKENILDINDIDDDAHVENSSSNKSRSKSKLYNSSQEKNNGCINLNVKSKVFAEPHSRNNAQDKNTTVCDEKDYDDLVFDDALAMVEEETQVSKLHMRRNKRSRYSEEISPEMKKRSRQASPGSSKSPLTSPTTPRLNKQTTPRKPAVFVPDTCAVNLDDSLVEQQTVKDKKLISKSRGKRLQKAAKTGVRVKSDSDSEVNTDFDMLVVPETLAMDADSDLSEDDVDLGTNFSDKNTEKKGISKNYKPDLSDIKELSGETSRKDRSVRDTGSDSQEKRSNRSKSNTSTKGTGKSSGQDENDGIKSSLQNILNSPRSDDNLEADTYIRQAVSSRDLDLDLNDSSVIMSDEDESRESQMNESKLTRKMCSLDKKSKALHMSEVDAMFETPEKRKIAGTSDKLNIERKKPLFKKHIENDQPTLRRSPRKHGESKLIDEKDCNTSPKASKKSSQNSKSHKQFSDSQSKKKSSKTQNQPPQTIESQSIDEYNIIPVQNGVPQTSEMFQFKVAKRKEANKKCEEISRQKPDETPLGDVERSPSILESRGQDTDVINLLSPTVGSTSDAESPLLLQNHRFKKSSQSSGSQKQKSPNKTSTSNKSKPSFKKPLAPRSRDNKKKYYIKQKNEEDLDETMAPGDNNGDHSSVLDEVKDQRSNVGSEVNGSLDPVAELSMWCKEPDTEASCRETATGQTLPSLPSLDDDFYMDDLHNDEIQRTSTLAMEDSQDIPSSSTSYKFGPRKKLSRKIDQDKDVENIDPEPAPLSKLDSSFDRVPKKVEAKVAHVAVVRKQDERQKLQGHSCKQCLEYYQAAGLGEDEIQHHMQKCSRHRAEFVPPDTPPHFWSVGFIDTQECVDRGYMKVEKQMKAPTEEPARFRRRRKLNKYFKSKNETSTLEPDSQDDF